MTADETSSLPALSSLFRFLQLKKSLQQTSESYNRKFNKCWGQLFKAGHQDSRFAKQVMDYACLYTSKVSNLGNISPHRSFRPLQDFMPHDQVRETENESAWLRADASIPS